MSTRFVAVGRIVRESQAGSRTLNHAVRVRHPAMSGVGGAHRAFAHGSIPGVVPGLAGLRCLVLGASGFLGLPLARGLHAAGAQVHGLARGAVPEDWPDRPWVQAPIQDQSALASALAGQEVVFHLAGSSLPHASNLDPVGDLQSQVVPTLRLLEMAQAAGVRRVVFASSGGAVYGIPSVVPTPESAPCAPISAYGIGKLTIERHLHLQAHLHGLQYQVLRIANPYGPGQSPYRSQGVVAAMMLAALEGRPLEMWGAGEVTRDFIHVDDVTAALLSAATYNGPHRIMNVGSGRGRSLTGVATDVAAAAGRPGLHILRKPGRPADVPVSVLDISLAERELGWRPSIGWQAGLADTASWMRRTHGRLPAGVTVLT